MVLRWLLLFALIPSVAAAPTLTAEASHDDFVLADGFEVQVNGTFACDAFDLDPDAVYTLVFTASHNVASNANASGIALVPPTDIALQAPCFPDGATPRSHAWSGVLRVEAPNATPGAMYHMDVVIDVTVSGRLGQEAPASVGVHTMGSLPVTPPETPAEEPPGEASPGPALMLITLHMLVMARRR